MSYKREDFGYGELGRYDNSPIVWTTENDIDNFILLKNYKTPPLSMYHIKDVLKDVSFIIDNESVTFSSLSADLINECIKTLENEGY